MKVNTLQALILLLLLSSSCSDKKKEYVCKPCALQCDELTFDEPGTCPYCEMELVEKSGLISKKASVINEIGLETGSGAFLIEGGKGNEGKTINVFFHMPKNFKPSSKILMVIPGAGRNADSYRDAWVEESEKYGILILCPMYREDQYTFGDYHICGLIKNLNLRQSIEYIENTNIARLNEEDFKFNVNANAEEWIFNDFDRIFDLVKAELNLTTTTYDLFGHSAGGHILHRHALFHRSSKADRIVASNASFYTLPNFEYSLPLGLKGSSLGKESLMPVFAKKLVIFLGELDNENETGGTFLRSKTADEQGLHRLARGRFFFESAKEKAKTLDYDFEWQIVVVPGVGHDHKKIGDAAADYLYGGN